MNTTIYHVEPNKWVDEKLITALTGLATRQIKEYRSMAWVEGKHYKKASPSGATGRNAKIMYNRIEIDKFFENTKRVA
ncbi:hypothetical protein ETN89_15130 [Photobacterium damselae subsp. damselae]|uniref:Excisionase (DUF1233) n=1 Tax=Photobacterium damselae TaxID=38293 RepID=A0A2T3Q7Q4_PHODM|nr:excisionase family protein [Photobacterium damselae]ARR51567.1 hypothetical protein CAY62_19440 [Photobacterium damselae subsp. damselae]KAB1181717.1 hypothetical protein F6477_04040 [Photobacterium damselae subsp. damselae]MBF7100431.1 DUF1233 family excisionase [Photobacterium damselae]PSW79944.1 hypothetical protein CTN07_20400 [Photobacterium damselae]QAY36653.1 hypothetical protein ETN89_15130 [Photobacterium damselae subsp. damselae]